MKKIALHLAIILLVTSFAYLNILQNDFVWEDADFILEWSMTRSMNLPEFFKGTVPQGHEKVYRPLRSVYYAIDYQLFGLSKIGYHVQSILIHLSVTVLLYFLTLKLTNKKLIAFMCSLLFGVHPVHTEAITHITPSIDIIGVIFFFLSFYLYIKAEKKWFALSIVFATLAFFSYELALTLPLFILLYEFSLNKGITASVWKKLSAYLIPILFYFFIRMILLGITSRASYLANSIYLTFLTMIKAAIQYVIITILPFNLNINHALPGNILSLSYEEVIDPYVKNQSFFNFDIILSLIVLSLITFIILKNIKKAPIISFGICWFFIGLLPVSNLIPLSIIFSEKYLYIPSFGFCLLLSYLFNNFFNNNLFKLKKSHHRILCVFLFMIVIISFVSITMNRNKDWKDSLSLWQRTALQTPNSQLAHNNLGTALNMAGKTNMAIAEYKKAIEINPKYPQAHYNLGFTYQNLGQFDLAIEHHSIAVALKPDYVEAIANLAFSLYKKGETQKAIEQYKKAILIRPNLFYLHNNLGVIYRDQASYALAIAEFKKAFEIAPDSETARKNLEGIYTYLNQSN